MASSNTEDGSKAANEQLGSMSLGVSAENKDNETERKAENGTNPTPMCSECGKKSTALKKCNGCKCVWYCGKKCQNKHRKEHKKECRRIMRELDKRGGKLDIGSELDFGPLGKVPQREECVICMRVLPLHDGLQGYYACCGKTICGGCFFRHEIKCGKQVDGGQTCAFCRVPNTRVDEEIFARLSKRVKLNDPKAVTDMAMKYYDGQLGLPLDQAKCIDLLRQSADLGYPDAHYQLGSFYRTGDMGLEEDQEEALRYFKEAAIGGHLGARHNVGYIEERKGDLAAAMRHWRLSASEGHRLSMEALIYCFEDGFLHHGDLAETLQAMYSSRSEMRSEDRDDYIKHLKKTGPLEYDYL